MRGRLVRHLSRRHARHLCACVEEPKEKYCQLLARTLSERPARVSSGIAG